MSKINDFKKFLLLERVGINNDIKIITDILYDLLKKSNKSINVYSGDLFKTNKILIDSIRVNLFEMDIDGSFDATASNITDTGINIVMNLDKNSIDKETIIHELNHALQFYMVGKDKFIEKTKYLKIHSLSSKFLNNDMINEFIRLLYYSDDSEVASFISESFYEIKRGIKLNLNTKISIDEYNNLFNFYYKESNLYLISTMLKNFNYKKFKSLNSDNLIIFFNVLNDKELLIDEIKKSNSKFKSILYSIKDILNNKYFSDSYYNKIDKSVKIENLDVILKKYDKRFKYASIKIDNKLPKIYDIILVDLKRDGFIL